MELNRFQDAVRDFDSYLFVNPNDVKAIFYQGLSYNKSGDTEKAKANALKMVDIDPAKEVYFSNEHLLDIYDLEMRRKVAKQSLEDATKNIKEYKSSSSKTLGNIKLAQAFAKLDKAWLYSSGIKNEDRDLGDTILKRIFEVYPQMTEKPELPELARKYMVQASTATEEKNYVPALILWNKAINIAPYYPLSYFNRALLKEILNDYKGAITDVKKYLELSPDASNARAAQDKIYEWEGKSRNSSTTITTSTLPGSVMQNKPVSSNASTAKPKFIFRTGLNIPKGVFAKAPDNIKDSAFLKSGNMGAKAGPFFEIGLGLAFSKEASKVQFYYNPLIASYATNQMSWGNSLATDTNRSIKIIEIAQRYGVAFKPTQKLLMAIFYRPAGVIPLNFKASVNGSQADGTMSTKMVFMMSHTFGFTVAYSFISLSFEMYYAHPTFDVTIPNSTNTGTVNVNAVKIPFRTNRIGIAFTF
jgi:tetratricopeptide (TPR) repeat protein